VEYAERAHELPELDDAVALEIEEVEDPVGEEVGSLAGPEQGELELLLMIEQRGGQTRSEKLIVDEHTDKTEIGAKELCFYYLVDEAVFDDGEAELLVELVQRLHLVHRDCNAAMHVR
jgi:hypothetical protein